MVNFLTSRARVNLASSMANRIPMQFLGPAPNGRKAMGWRSCLASGRNLECVDSLLILQKNWYIYDFITRYLMLCLALYNMYCIWIIYTKQDCYNCTLWNRIHITLLQHTDVDLSSFLSSCTASNHNVIITLRQSKTIETCCIVKSMYILRCLQICAAFAERCDYTIFTSWSR